MEITDLNKKNDEQRIMILGLRGIPHIQGGIEKHVEHLAPLIRQQGFDVEVVGRHPYVPCGVPGQWQGVKLKTLFAPKSKYLETITHTFIGILRAAFLRPDILHLHAIGPALLTPLARLLGLKVIVTHHGYDYDRDKWHWFARAVLRFGEYLGMRFANGRIAVSLEVANRMEQRYGVSTQFIPNGIAPVSFPVADDCLARFDMTSRGYILLAARLVPEKRQLDLIRAFLRLEDKKGMKLAIVGGADHQDDYAKLIRQQCDSHDDVVMTGFQSGRELEQLFAHARLFVLPSSHEGMPIALLEALSYGLPVLASDIVANMALNLPHEDYFPLGDVEALSQALGQKLAVEFNEELAEQQQSAICQSYSWGTIAEQNCAVYRSILSNQKVAELSRHSTG